MAKKVKTFAEKMLKHLKEKEDYNSILIVRPRVTDKKSVKFESRIVKVHKEANESEVLGV